MGAQEPKDKNDRLSEHQSRVLAYLLANPVTIPAEAWVSEPFMDGFEDQAVAVASNESTLSRNARQFLVWCVSDFDPEDPWADGSLGLPGFCGAAIPVERQQQMAKIVEQAEQVGELTQLSATAEPVVGKPAELTLTTSLG